MRDANGAHAAVKLDPESEQDGQLVAVLQDLIDRDGRDAVARRFEVSERTLRRAVTSGQLSGKLAKALEAAQSKAPEARLNLLEREVAALRSRVVEQKLEREARAGDEGGEVLRQRLDGLEDRLQDVEQQLADGLASLRAEVSVLHGSSPPAQLDHVLENAAGQTQRFFPRRSFPQLVTVEPADDDEHNFGGAWPVVAEWRAQRTLSKAHWPSVEGRQAQVRMLELELALFDEQGLTLPPEHYPMPDALRPRWSYEHRQSLRLYRRELRRARVRRWAVRLLTLGLRS